MKKLISLVVICMPARCMAQPLIDSFNSKWSTHFQLTFVSQGHPAFHAAYSGQNSLPDSAENALSLTSTIFIGRKLWTNAAFYIDPEIAGGKGIGSVKGIAGFTNGETFRIGDPSPALYIARAYLQQIIPLKGAKYIDDADDVNHVAGKYPTAYIKFSVGKFAVSDFFDNNKYSHDPRTQFLNWSLMSNGAWDYPANTRGYTVGLITELIKPSWSVRFGIAQVPAKANGPKMDPEIFKANSEMLEVEKNFLLDKRRVVIRLLLFHNLSQAPTYKNAVVAAAAGDSSSLPVFTGNYEWKKYGGQKWGYGINAECQLAENIGLFLRNSYNDGKTATWAFTEIDYSVSGGLQLNTKLFNSFFKNNKRVDDNFGIAMVGNQISTDHQVFLQRGFYGFIIGDGKLSRYGMEWITECYYNAKLTNNIFLTGDIQQVINPGYNPDRGPVYIFSVRCHVSF